MIQNSIQGQLMGTGLKMAIVVSRFNEMITSKLLEGCVNTLTRHGVAGEDIYVVWVPGAFEIGFAATQLMDRDAFDAIVCLGAVIQGSTPHFDIVSAESAKSIRNLNLEGNIPVIYGVLTTHTIEQAIERAGTKAGNKGVDAAMAAIEMANLAKTIATYPIASQTPVAASKRGKK